MGVLDHFSNLCTVSRTRKKSKRKPFQSVEIEVKMDCGGCERTVRDSVSSMRGVESVEIVRIQSWVRVKGYVNPNKVLKRIRSTGKRAEIWPYIEYNLVSYPYVAEAYDWKAPRGYVKNVVQAVPGPDAPIVKYTTIFSDDNPNACSIM